MKTVFYKLCHGLALDTLNRSKTCGLDFRSQVGSTVVLLDLLCLVWKRDPTKQHTCMQLKQPSKFTILRRKFPSLWKDLKYSQAYNSMPRLYKYWLKVKYTNLQIALKFIHYKYYIHLTTKYYCSSLRILCKYIFIFIKETNL